MQETKHLMPQPLLEHINLDVSEHSGVFVCFLCPQNTPCAAGPLLPHISSCQSLLGTTLVVPTSCLLFAVFLPLPHFSPSLIAHAVLYL